MSNKYYQGMYNLEYLKREDADKEIKRLKRQSNMLWLANGVGIIALIMMVVYILG